MSDQNKPGILYWSVIEPHWDSLVASWEDVESFLRAYRKVPKTVQHLFAAHWCQSEVCNGGLFQFFYNSTGILAPEAAEAFEPIGFSELSSIVTEAMSYFGDTYPRDRLVRLDLMPDRSVGKRKDWDPFIELDTRFYNCLDAERNLWERRADSYAAVA